MKRRIALALAVLMLASPVASLAEDISEAWLRRAFRVRDVVGGAVIISRYGETVFSMVYGSKSGSKKDPVTLDTCFRIASVTKLVTAVGLMQLVERGYCDLDDDMSALLPFKIVNTVYRSEPLTVRQALTHTTGAKQTQSVQINWDYVSARSTESLFKPHASPGTRYVYSNVNGGLYGALIEALSGQSVNMFMRENVFEPLGVNAAYTPRLLPDKSDISHQLSKKGNNIMSPEFAMEEEYEDTCDPARHLSYTVGGLYISANGLNRIGMMLCNEGWLDGVRILDPYTVRLMQADQSTLPGSSVSADSPYGLGLQRVTDDHGNTWYGHQGMKDGLTSDLFYLPEQGLVVTVIANGYTGLKEGALVSLAIRTMNRAVETDWDKMNEPADFAWDDVDDVDPDEAELSFGGEPPEGGDHEFVFR